MLSDQQISIVQYTLLQFWRRIVFHEPVLSLKALDKVSFKDLILDEDFSLEDAARLWIMFGKRLGFGLLWWKDSVLEALTIASPVGNAANVGDPSEYIYWARGSTFIFVCARKSVQDSGWLDIQPPTHRYSIK
jgi:hypothetical protein